MRAIIERVGPYRPRTVRDPLTALVASIVHQQVSMKAGAAIFRRVRGLCPRRRLSARALASISPVELRGAGLSRQKAVYVRGIARSFHAGELTSRRLRRMSDEDVIEATTRLKGVGRWTAEMLLLFCLERADVWPVDDFGLRKGLQRFLGLDEMPPRDIVRETGETWRPYRSYACWYLWRSLDGGVLPGIG
jgi:DNA-3-methyladenine glycosylase II